MSNPRTAAVEHGRHAPAIVVVGGGVAGLTAAYRLVELAEESRREVAILLLESSDRLGGTVATAHRDGLVMERGPDSMITEKPWGVELCRELGLSERLVATDQRHRGSFIAHGAELRRVPEGFHLLAPSLFWPFLRSRVVSLPGKLRMAADLVIPRRTDDVDESLAGFVRRRLGQEALERVAQPMIGGIYTADPERLSLRATMPRFIEMERKHGSLLRAMIAARKTSRAVSTGTGPRYDLFVSFDQGMEALTRELAGRLPAGTVRTDTPVRKIVRRGDRWALLAGDKEIAADSVCLAAPAYAAATMLEETSPALAGELAAIPYASVATVNLTYARDDVAHPLDGFGFVVPAAERRTTIACSFSSVKYPGRAPEGLVLLRTFVGGALSPESLDLDDAEMVEAVTRDLRELIGLRGKARDVLVSRFGRAMPQYHVGHLARMDRIDRLVAELPGLRLAGSAYRGTGIPDCVRGADEAARGLFEAVGRVAASSR